MRTSSCVVVAALAACSAPAKQQPPPSDPVTGHLQDPMGLPVDNRPPAVDAGAAPVDTPPAVDAGAAPVVDIIATATKASATTVTAAKVSWPTDRRPAQLHLLGGGVPFSEARAVSSDGSTPVGIAQTRAGREQAVRWRDGMLTPLAAHAPVAGQGTWALATSRNGDVVAGVAISADGQTSTALAWRASGDVTVLATPDGLNGARATGVSRDGSIITGCAGACSSLVTWQKGKWDSRPAPEKFEAGANGLSENGATLAGTADRYGDKPEAMRVTGDKVERLGAKTRVEGISDDGAVLVGSAGGRAALWRGKKLTDLGVLPDYETCHATAISADGGRVVGTCRREKGSVAFIWDKKRGLRPLHDALTKEHKVAVPADVWFDEANDICGYGLTVVGSAQSPSSAREAFLAIVPR